MPDAPLLTIRPSQPADASLAVELIHLSMGAEAELFFGAVAGHHFRDVLADLFVQPGNRFSLDATAIAEVDHQPAGLLLAYSSASMPRRDLVTGRHLLQIVGLSGLVPLVLRLLPFSGVREVGPGEFYINSLAVLPSFQGRGVGRRLLAHVEALARSLGLTKCSLLVALDNPGARRLYERSGYRVVATKRFSQPKLAAFGVQRMVKNLAKSTDQP